MLRPGEKRGRRCGSVTAALLILVSALSSLSIGSGVSAQSTTVTFAFWGDPAEQAAYERVISEFEAVNPGIDIRSDYTPDQDDYVKKIATSFAAGNAPDLFLLNYRTFGQYAAANALEPVDSYLRSTESINAADYYAAALGAFQSGDGRQFCMPQNISSLVVYYNEDLFAANDVPFPADDWTWADFLAAATALTRDANGDGTVDTYGVVVEQSLYRMAPFIWANGGELVDDPDHPTTLTLDTPGAIEALTWFAGLGVSGAGVVPTEIEARAEDDEARFMRGGAGMYLQSRRVVPALRQIDGFTWNVAPLPAARERATVLHSDAFCMAAAAPDKDAAWAFIEFAAGDRGQTILAETGRVVPSLRRIAESDAFLNPTVDDEPLLPANNQVFLDNIAYLHRLPTISTWLEVEDTFNARFERIFYEEIDITAAIAAVTAETRPIFTRAYE